MMGAGICATEPVWKSEDNWVELPLSLYLYVGSKDHSQVTGLCGECPYLLRFHRLLQ